MWDGRETFETLRLPRVAPGPVRLLTFPVVENGRLVHLVQVAMPLAGVEDARTRFLLILVGLAPLAALLGQTCIQEVGQDPPLLPIESGEDRAPTAPNPAVVVLPQWMVITHARFAALVLIEISVEAPRERVHGFQRAAALWREKSITAVDPGPGQDPQTCAKFEKRTAIHAAVILPNLWTARQATCLANRKLSLGCGSFGSLRRTTAKNAASFASLLGGRIVGIPDKWWGLGRLLRASRHRTVCAFPSK